MGEIHNNFNKNPNCAFKNFLGWIEFIVQYSMKQCQAKVNEKYSLI